MPINDPEFHTALKAYIDASDYYTLASVSRFTVMNALSSTPGAKAEAAALQGEAEDELRRCVHRVSLALALDVPSDPGLKAFIAAFDADEAARTRIDPMRIADDEAPAAAIHDAEPTDRDRVQVMRFAAMDKPPTVPPGAAHGVGSDAPANRPRSDARRVGRKCRVLSAAAMERSPPRPLSRSGGFCPAGPLDRPPQT